MKKINYQEFYNKKDRQNSILMPNWINYDSPTIASFFYERKKLIDKEFKKFKKDVRVLDVGSGQGNNLSSLWTISKKKDSFLGIDIDSEAIIRTKKWTKINKIKNIDFEKVDISKLNWADSIRGTFNLIILSEVIEHLYSKDQEIMLRNISKKLSPEGRLIITCPNKSCLVKKLIKVGKKIPFVGEKIKIELKGSEGHVAELSYSELNKKTSKYFDKVKQG